MPHVAAAVAWRRLLASAARLRRGRGAAVALGAAGAGGGLLCAGGSAHAATIDGVVVPGGGFIDEKVRAVLSAMQHSKVNDAGKKQIVSRVKRRFHGGKWTSPPGSVATDDLHELMSAVKEMLEMHAGEDDAERDYIKAWDSQMDKVMVRMLVRKADIDGSGYVTRDEIISFFKWVDEMLRSIHQERQGLIKTTSIVVGKEDGKEKKYLKAVNLQRDPGAVIAHEERLEIYRRLFFRLFDTDGNGVLDKNEFKEYVKLVHGPVSLSRASTMWRNLDTSQDGVISYSEFRDHCANCYYSREEWVALRAAGLGAALLCCYAMYSNCLAGRTPAGRSPP